ncbi:hypothetical protein V9T40_012840 [Parthenolecanium corni]|uniref:Uncharacterized protein n=1 Tax=Parthenolecanium corni TaxID=536013 RepID=A0AAN9TBM7_9HEMI
MLKLDNAGVGPPSNTSASDVPCNIYDCYPSYQTNELNPLLDSSSTPSHTVLTDIQHADQSNLYYRSNDSATTNNGYKSAVLPAPHPVPSSTSYSHQYQSSTVAGHPRYDSSPYPASCNGANSYWSTSNNTLVNTSNSVPAQQPSSNNFHHHQNYYTNYYHGAAAPVQNNPFTNSVVAPLPPPPPPHHPSAVVFCPNLYSNVNKNELHLHLHHAGDLNKPVEQYADDVAAVVGSSNLIITGGSRSIEIDILPSNGAANNGAATDEQNDIGISRYSDRQSDSSFWRPYCPY